MTNPGPTQEEYDSLICKLATLEIELDQARMLLEAPAKVGWWKRFWGLGAKATVVALVVAFLLLPAVPCRTYAAENKESIKAIMGEPSLIKRGADGKETWIYVIRKGEEDFPIYRLFARNRSVKGFIFVFDKNGNLK
ncbi:MAG: hypothetical protein ACLQUS_14835 [Desulfobaccales bacterium]